MPEIEDDEPAPAPRPIGLRVAARSVDARRTAAKSGRPWAVKAHDLRIEQRVAPTESRNGLADELRERPAEVRLAPRAQACAATVVMCPAAPRGRSPATALDYRLLRAYVGTLDRDLLCGLRAAHRDPEQA